MQNVLYVKMEKLSLCRICLSDDIPLRSIIKTHLQEMYESLTKTPFVAEDIRPVLVCHLCCAELENSIELKEKCLQSEKLFAELLQSNVQVNLQIMPDVHLSTEDVIQMTPNFFGNDEVKQENFEDTRDDRSTSSDSQNDAGTEYFIKPDPDVDNATPIFEEGDHVQSSDTEDIISLAVVKAEPSDVTGNDAAVEQDDSAVEQDDAAVEQGDADLYHSALGLHTECDIPLDIVKEESGDVDTGAPRLAAHKYCNDTLSSNLKSTNQIMDKVEEPKTETGRDIEDKPVKKNKIVDTRGKIDKKNKQNYSTSDHSDVHKEMSGNKISAVQSVNSGSSNKLTPLLCDTCQKCFKYKSDLIKHTRIHTGEKPYECNVCKKCFNQRGQLNIHTRLHTDDKPFKCNECTKCFSQSGNLKVHMRIHTGEKPYECNVCKKCFNRRDQLNIHTRLHSDDKPFKCNECTKCFNQSGHLKVHMRMHTGEKPYECNVCSKCFKEKGTLNTHMLTHTGEKTYECNICKKCFNLSSNLQKHIFKHTGEKPYKCDVCNKCFNDKSHLKSHIRLHTNKKPYECNVCKKCFSRKYYLSVHIRTHAGGKP